MPFDPAAVQAILFDIDGTLNDTDDLLVSRLARWLGLLPAARRKAVARRLVMGMASPGNAVYGWLDTLGLDGPAVRLAERLNQRRGAPPASYSLVPGVRGMLWALRARYPLAIVSARDESVGRAFIARCGLRGLFASVAGALTVEHTKPYPDPVLWTARQLGVRPQNCLMVGDTAVDVRAGRSAGAQTAGVLCGFGREVELRRAGAGLILETTADLAQVLR